MDEECPREVGWRQGPDVHRTISYRYYLTSRGGQSRAIPAIEPLESQTPYQKQVVIGVTWPTTTLLKYVTLSGGL